MLETSDVWSAVSVHTGRALNDRLRQESAQLALEGRAVHSRQFAMYVPYWETSRRHGPLTEAQDKAQRMTRGLRYR